RSDRVSPSPLSPSPLSPNRFPPHPRRRDRTALLEVPRPSGSLRSRMFDALSDRFEGIFKRLRGRGRLGETEIDEVLREIRVALLEADVNVRVARTLIGRIKEQCLAVDLSKSLTPAQQVIKIVHDALVEALGGENLRIT